MLIAPEQRLTDDLVLICAKEMPQEPFGGLLVNERSERAAFRTPPSVQLDRKIAVINDALKGWRISQVLLRQFISCESRQKRD
jgi:hypothetical protein